MRANAFRCTHNDGYCVFAVIVQNSSRLILWLRGDYKGFQNYDLDTVGLIEKLN